MMMQWLFIFLFISSLSRIPIIVQSRCNHQAELSALLHFKDGFEINRINSYDDDFGYPKTSSWKNGSAEWDGVECDPITGHVIGLDLSSSCLHGSINSSSSIFTHLVHLEHLNLAFNDFQGSSIPSKLGNFSRLSYLNLSYSTFKGWVPLEISKLSMLTSLDLSSFHWELELNFKSLVMNLTNLEELDLTSTISRSEVPEWLFANMSSLRSLNLERCGLYGEFPQAIFHLPKLQHLSVRWNDELEGHLPTEFNSSTTLLLESLVIGGTDFNGTIPVSIGNQMILLRELDLSDCKLSGYIPASLGNLTHLITLDLSYFNTFPTSNNFTTLSSWVDKLTNLRYLDIPAANLIGEIPYSSLANITHLSTLDFSKNQLSGMIPPSFLGNLTDLSGLDLSGNILSGQIPSVFTKLTKLVYLILSDNQLTGEIPYGFLNLTRLVYLDLSNNTLHGQLPIQNLRNLEYLSVIDNQLSDTLDLEMFLEFRNLTYLGLSSNNLTLLQKRNASDSTLPSLEFLGLSSCRLSKFPELLMHQTKLTTLYLSYNNIEGAIPRWIGNIKSLEDIDVSHNFITGSVPFPSPSVVTYRASNNELIGEIPRSFCNLTSLLVLDFSANRLTGELDPHCFSKYGLTVLNLQNNSFHGKLPEFCTSGRNSTIRMIDLNSNQFQGKIPRSIANCAELEFFDAGSNFINDTFPSWLGSLSLLKVLILKDNALHGSIWVMPNMSSGYWFPELIIIDLSQNRLSGNLTSLHFEQWIAMKTTNFRNSSYMGQYIYAYWTLGEFYEYSLTMNNKGTKREYPKILDALVAIDLSNNEFEGEIPTTIGELLGLRSINLSNNHISGGIPSPLGDLKNLESLDLSSNRLSGQIPRGLTGLSFLSAFDVSSNNLTGLIPQGPHFDTFSNISYLENPGLCGVPLSRKCETSTAQPPDEMVEKEDTYWKGEIFWMVVAIGFGGGLVVGIAVENIIDWRMLILSWRSRNWRRNRG